MLARGECEGQLFLQPARAQRRGLLQSGRAAQGSPPRAAAQEDELGEQQLLERQAAASLLDIVCIAREMQRAESRRAIGEALAVAQLGRQRLDHIAERVACFAHEREQLRGVDALGGGVVTHRCAPRGGRVLHRNPSSTLPSAHVGAHGVVGYAEGAPLPRLAMQHQTRAGGVFLHEPGLIEEHRAHSPSGVGDPRLHERAHTPTTHRPRGDRAHLDGHGGLLADAQLSHRARLAILAREVLQQVAHGVQAQRVESPRRLGCGRLQRLAEARGARPAHARGEHLCARKRFYARKRGEVGIDDRDCNSAGHPHMMIARAVDPYSAASSHQ